VPDEPCRFVFFGNGLEKFIEDLNGNGIPGTFLFGVITVPAIDIAGQSRFDDNRKIRFHAPSEGPVGPNAAESVRDVTAASQQNDDTSDETDVPSRGVTASFVITATIIAPGISAVNFFVLALRVINGSGGHRGHGDECRGRLAHIKCGQVFNGLCIV
jgi:hypothetical protein